MDPPFSPPSVNTFPILCASSASTNYSHRNSTKELSRQRNGNYSFLLISARAASHASDFDHDEMASVEEIEVFTLEDMAKMLATFDPNHLQLFASIIGLIKEWKFNDKVYLEVCTTELLPSHSPSLRILMHVHSFPVIVVWWNSIWIVVCIAKKWGHQDVCWGRMTRRR